MNSLILMLLALLVIATWFVFIPMIRFRDDKKEQQVTAGWFEQRLTELREELAQGQFSQQEYDAAVLELKITAKNELTTATELSDKHLGGLTNKTRALVAFIFVSAVSVFYYLNGNLGQLKQWQDALEKLPELTEKIIKNQDSPATPEELQQFSLGLRTKLMAQDDAIGWMLLGRTYLAMNDVNTAISAFQKAYERQPDSISNVINYAQALYMKGEEFELNQAFNLLRQALQMDPQNTMALILFAETNLMLERYEYALEAFELVLAKVEPSDYRYEALTGRIDFLKQTLGLSLNAADESHSAAGLAITVSVDAAINTQAYKYVFIFAKSPDSPIPVAVKKLDITGFPLNITLSDADTMLPDVKLSEQKVVNVTARLSLDDAAELSSGEYEGTALELSPKLDTPVNIIITKDKQ